MSLYTTGELAKKCNVSVRTIQYYDERGILVPTDLTEGDEDCSPKRMLPHWKRFAF